jgi:type IV secretory pathway VirB10-like protein
MFSKPLAFALLAAGCMTAAAGGAYVALRQTVPSSETQPATVQGVSSAQAASDATVPVATDGTAYAAAPPAAPPQEVIVETRAVTPITPTRRREAVRRSTPRRTQAANRERPVAEQPIETTPASVPETPVEPAPAPAMASLDPAPQLPRYEELVVPSETVIGVQVDTAVSSERARVEDRVEGHVTRDVSVGGRVAIPAGTKMLGSVTLVERGGKFKERARVAVRFHTVQLSDGTRVALQTPAIMREGESPSRETAAKVGGSAVGGAILGAILGGAKGAVLGGTAGAAGGTAVVAAGGRNAATLPAGTAVSVRLMSDVTMMVER